MMKRLFFLFLLIFVGVTAWRITERLSADAIGMALGVLFGILAGLPVALLVLAAAKRRDHWQDEGQQSPYGPSRRGLEAGAHGYPMQMQQPPVIVLAGPGYPAMQQGHQPPTLNTMMLPGPQAMAGQQGGQRSFKVIGEQVADLEEW
jgi:hypothetical protein